MSMKSGAGNGAQPDGREGDPVACNRCAGAVELLTVLPRSGDHPAFRIFGCPACSFVEWVAQKIAD